MAPLCSERHIRLEVSSEDSDPTGRSTSTFGLLHFAELLQCADSNLGNWLLALLIADRFSRTYDAAVRLG